MVNQKGDVNNPEDEGAAVVKRPSHFALIVAEIVEFKLSPCLDKSSIACCGGGSALIRWSVVQRSTTAAAIGRNRRACGRRKAQLGRLV